MAEIAEIIHLYERMGSVWRVGEAIGLSGQTVHSRLRAAGVDTTIRVFSENEKDFLRAEYRSYVDAGKLTDLAVAMDRTKQFICRQAKALGLTDAVAARKMATSASAKKTRGTKMWTDRPHPRGFSGRKHTDDTKILVSKAAKNFWDTMTEDQKSALVEKQLRAKVEWYGTISPNIKRGSWKAAWREIGGQRKYFRSRWEANYARYLEWLKARGDISDWRHEPETFWFEGIKRGTRSYLPDFRVTNNDGSSELHEVKGWEDARSKTIFKRMAKYHPEQRLIVIRAKEYDQIERSLSRLIEGWE